MSSDSSIDVFKTIEGVKESWEIGLKVKLVYVLEKNREACEMLYDKIINKIGPHTNSYCADEHFVNIESHLRRYDIKELLDQLSINKEFRKLKEERGENCYRDLAHCMVVVLVDCEHIKVTPIMIEHS